MQISLLQQRETRSIIGLLLSLKGLPLAACWRRERCSAVSENKTKSQVPAVSSHRGKWQKGQVCFFRLKLSIWPPGRKTKRSIWPSVYLTGSVPGKKNPEPTHSPQIYQESMCQEVRNRESFWGDNRVCVTNHLFHNQTWGRICISLYFSFPSRSVNLHRAQAAPKSPNGALLTQFICL